MFKIRHPVDGEPTHVVISMPDGRVGEAMRVDAYMLESCTIAIETLINVQQFLRYMKIEESWPDIRSAMYEMGNYPPATFHKGQRLENAARILTVVMQWIQRWDDATERGFAGVRLMFFTQTLYQLEAQVSANNLFKQLQAGERAKVDNLKQAYPEWNHDDWDRELHSNQALWTAQLSDPEVRKQIG